MTNAIAALMLVTLVPSQPLSAQMASFEGLAFAALAQSENISAFDSTEPIPVAPAPTVQEVLLSVCEAKGYGQPCAQTLLGMLWNESSNVSTAIGDRGKARGYFQIWTKLHNTTVECAEDLVCSANWTLKYMERNQYPKYVNWAVQCHNGCGFNNGYRQKAVRNGAYFWDKPLEIKQVAEIVLPVLVTPVQVAVK